VLSLDNKHYVLTSGNGGEKVQNVTIDFNPSNFEINGHYQTGMMNIHQLIILFAILLFVIIFF
jgi:hypothetical protein